MSELSDFKKQMGNYRVNVSMTLPVLLLNDLKAMAKNTNTNVSMLVEQFIIKGMKG
jgi:hypothetical protein